MNFRHRSSTERPNTHHPSALVLFLALAALAVPRGAVAQWQSNGVALSTASSNHLSRPVTASDGAGGVLMCWTDARGGSGSHVYVQRVDAAGVRQWGPDGVRVCTNAGLQSVPAIVSDEASGAIIAWVDRRAGNADVYAQRLSPAGAPLWNPDGVAISTAPLDQDQVALAADGFGGAFVAWHHNTNLVSVDNIQAQRLTSSGSVQWAAGGVPVCTASGSQFSPRLFLLNGGVTVVAWLDDRGSDTGVYAQRLDGSGSTVWTSDGVNISSTGDANSIAIAGDGAGGIIVSYDRCPGGNCQTTYDLFAQRVSAAGTVLWAAGGVPVCTASGNQPSFSSATDGGGGVIIAWEDFRGSSAIYAQRLNGSGAPQWVPNGVLLCSSAAGIPVVQRDGAGGAIICWSDYRASFYGVYSQRIDASGIPQWTASGVALCGGVDPTTASYQLDVSSDLAGGVIVAWLDGRGGYVGYAQRVNPSGTPQWKTNGVPSVDAANKFPAIVTDGAGGAIVAWNDRRNGVDDDVYVRRVLSTGALPWPGNGVAVCTAAGDQVHVVVASDGAGGVIVAWADRRSASHIYAQRVDANGNALWAANGVVVASVSWEHQPAIVADGSGGAIITWSDLRNEPIYGDIYAQRVNAAGVPQWPANGVPVCLAGSLQQNPLVVADGAHGAVVSWMDYRSGLDLYAQRLDASGVRIWATPDLNGVPVCTASGDQKNQVMVSDDAGGAIVAWEDLRSASHIYAQRISAAGVNQSWGGNPNGVVVCSVSYETQPAIATDMAGGAVIAWLDTRNEPLLGDIYAQRVGAGGSVQWAANGVPVCLAGSLQGGPSIVSDGASGTLLCWWDYRAGLDVYAQKLDAAGAHVWLAPDFNGVPVCTAANDQNYPVVVANGNGGAVVTWADLRGGSHFDVYAQHLNATGTIAGVSPMDEALGTSTRAWPNPFRGRIALAVGVDGSEPVVVDVLDVAGRVVRTLRSAPSTAGTHRLSWDGRNDAGLPVEAGVYFVRVAGFPAATRPIIRMR